VAQPVHCLIRDLGVAAKQCMLDVHEHLPAKILAQMRVEGLCPLPYTSEGICVDLSVNIHHDWVKVQIVQLRESIILTVLHDGGSLHEIRVTSQHGVNTGDVYDGAFLACDVPVGPQDGAQVRGFDCGPLVERGESPADGLVDKMVPAGHVEALVVGACEQVPVAIDRLIHKPMKAGARLRNPFFGDAAAEAHAVCVLMSGYRDRGGYGEARSIALCAANELPDKRG